MEQNRTITSTTAPGTWECWWPSRLLILSYLSLAAAPAQANQPYLVKDINPAGPSIPTFLTNVGNRLFFNADDGAHGRELWVSDGTEEGTYMVVDLTPGAKGPNPYVLTNANGRVFFHAMNLSGGMDLYVSDGTSGGTSFVTNLNNDGSIYAEMAALGDWLIFRKEDSFDNQGLWRTDGTPQGTVLLKDINVNAPVGIGDTVFFASDSGGTIPGSDLWRTDGTVEGTIRIAELGGAIFFTDVNGNIFFRGDLSETGRELWVSDGTPEGTHLVKDIFTGPGHSEPADLTNVEGTLFFTAFTPTTGRELWKSDGTEEGTVPVRDISPPGTLWPAAELTDMDGTLIFRVYDPVEGWQIWKSDGTELGTVLVKTIAPADVLSDLPRYFTYANGKVYFEASDGVHGAEPWITDGTAGGTYMVADINSGPSGSGFDPTLVGPLLFFLGANNDTGSELWALDTTPPVIPVLSPYGLLVFSLLLVVVGVLVLARKPPACCGHWSANHD